MSVDISSKPAYGTPIADKEGRASFGMQAFMDDLEQLIQPLNITDENFTSTLLAKLNGIADGAQVNKLVQEVSTQDGAVNTGTTVMVFDDTIPQNTEGDEYMTLTVTPGSLSNILEIDVVVYGSKNSSGGNLAAALFRDSVADALAAGAVRIDTNNVLGFITFRHRMTAPSVSAITFKVRAGASANTFTFNGVSSARIFGGVMASSITIKEFAP